jgi:hypothetical protein
MSIFNKKKLISGALVLTLASTLFANVSFAKDYKGHWAEPLIEKWVNAGLINGYSDGSFKPNKNIKRAEIVSLINKSFGFKTQGTATFNDVSKSDWYYEDVQKAQLAGYISGYSGGTFKPEKNISREEIAFIISKLLKLKASTSATTYKDTKKLTWSKDAVGAVIDNGIMNGYEDQTFRPGASATRAEVVAILDRSLKKYKVPVTNKEGVYNLAGVYGDVTKSTSLKGTVQINASGVALVNTVIDGDLFLNEGIGDGDVVLNKVTVTGRTIVKGGGVNSIHFENSTIGSVVVNKVGGNIRLVVSGTTEVKDVSLQSGAKLEESNVVGSGFGNITLAAELPKDSKVNLAGDFAKVTVLAKETAVEVASGQINELSVDKTATNTKVQLSAKANVSTLQLDAPTAVSGEGTVEKANVTVAGSTIEKAPAKLDIAANVKITVAGKDKDASSEEVAVIGGGFGGGAATPARPTGENTYLTAAKAVRSGTNITLARTPADGTTVWFAPAGTTSFAVGTTMTKSTTSTLAVPAAEGNYRLYLVDGSGGVSDASTAVLTVDDTAPTNQNQILASSKATKGGESLTLSAAPATGVTAWLAPSGTTTFVVGSSMTKLVGDGQTRTILAPSSDDEYKLYLIDSAGNISQPSTVTVIVDNVAPTNQNTILSGAKKAKPGASLTLDVALEAGFTAWLAPAGTQVFSESASMTKMIGGGGAKTITAPTTENPYKLYIVDVAGNISAASTAIVTVSSVVDTTPNAALANSKYVKGNTIVTLDAPITEGLTAWFAQNNIGTFTSTSATKTKSVNGVISSPTTAGEYRLYIVEDDGTVIGPSLATLTVDDSAPTNQSTVFATNKSAKGGTNILLDAAPEAGITAWFAQTAVNGFVEGTTMKKLVGNGVSKSIVTPTEAGSYKLYLVDRAGNVSSASTSTLTVITAAPTNQNTVFSTSVVKKSGTLTLNAAPGSGVTAWFAPANTGTFTEGATMTKSTTTTINVPTTEGTYNLYLVDEVGNASSASTATLTVDLTAPTNQNTLFNADKTVRGSVSVTLNGTLSAGQSAWFAPSGTTTFVESTTIAKMSNGVLKAPQLEGEYRLYVLDEVENASNPSTKILKVDNSSPTNQNQIFTAAKSVKSGAVVSLSGTLETGAKVWFAPEGTTEFNTGNTMTSSTTLQLNAPVSEAKYKLYVIDAAGNVSSSSTYELTVDNTPPTGASTAFATGKAVNSQTVVSIVTVTDTTAWFAPLGTTEFVESASMTRYQGGQIKAPNAEGEYRLFLLDEAGNVSIPSDATLKVDDTRPTSQNALLPASITRTHGTQITLSGTLGAGETLWIAPAVAEITLTTVESSTMKKSTTTTIAAPDTLANYKVFVIDEAGNVSDQSTYTITIN